MPLHDSLLEFLKHELYGVGLDELYDLIKNSKDGNLLDFEEGKELILPDTLDDTELVLDLVFFLGSVNELRYLLKVLENLKQDKVIKEELWKTEDNDLLSDSHQVFLVTFLHEL